MSEEQGAIFKTQLADVAAMVQAEAESILQGGQPRQELQPVVKQQQPTTEGQGPASTAEPKPLVDGKFVNEEERKKAHHALIHSLNAEKAKTDAKDAEIAALKAQLAATPAPAPLSPGRVDPVATESEQDKKWREQYGIDPADLRAEIRREASALVEQQTAPQRAMAAAEQYVVSQYPDFPARVEEIKAFVAASPAVQARVQDLANRGLFAEAMEIGYLAYDNALRAFNIAQATNGQTEAEIAAQRAQGSLISTQASGPREPQRSTTAFPQTAEDWAQINAMKARGQDVEVRRILFGRSIAHIPELNGGRQR
jgi:hypothetical protein